MNITQPQNPTEQSNPYTIHTHTIRSTVALITGDSSIQKVRRRVRTALADAYGLLIDAFNHASLGQAEDTQTYLNAAQAKYAEIDPQKHRTFFSELVKLYDEFPQAQTDIQAHLESAVQYITEKENEPEAPLSADHEVRPDLLVTETNEEVESNVTIIETEDTTTTSPLPGINLDQLNLHFQTINRLTQFSILHTAPQSFMADLKLIHQAAQNIKALDVTEALKGLTAVQLNQKFTDQPELQELRTGAQAVCDALTEMCTQNLTPEEIDLIVQPKTQTPKGETNGATETKDASQKAVDRTLKARTKTIARANLDLFNIKTALSDPNKTSGALEAAKHIKELFKRVTNFRIQADERKGTILYEAAQSMYRTYHELLKEAKRALREHNPDLISIPDEHGNLA